jgi:hypothetical protein
LGDLEASSEANKQGPKNEKREVIRSLSLGVRGTENVPVKNKRKRSK